MAARQRRPVPRLSAAAPAPVPRMVRKARRLISWSEWLFFTIGLDWVLSGFKSQVLPDGDRLLAVAVPGAPVPDRKGHRHGGPRFERDGSGSPSGQGAMEDHPVGAGGIDAVGLHALVRLGPGGQGAEALGGQVLRRALPGR